MRLFRRFALVACFSGAIAIGCSTFGGNSPEELPIPLGTDAGLDGRADDATSDSVQLQPNVDGSTNHFCATVDAAFCADFDEGPLLEEGWTGLQQGNGTGALDSADASSPPNVFAARIKDLTGAYDAAGPIPDGFAILSRELVRGGKSKVALDFDMRAHHLAAPGTYMAVTSVVFTRSPLRLLSVTVDQNGSSIAVYDPDLKVIEPAAKLPTGWFHLRFEIDIKAATARLLYDGMTVAATEAGVVTVEPGVAVDVGIYVGTALSPYAVDYDNVVVTFLD